MQGHAWEDLWARQLALDSVGEQGQRALGKATVAVVGAGALGSNSAELLARMGVGTVRVIDRDVLETSNLHRVRVLGEDDLGRPKAEALAERLAALAPWSRVEGVVEDVNGSNALGLLQGADVVIDGLDNMPARYVLNDACLELGVPWVYGGVVATSGIVAAFGPGGPCLRCLFPNVPREGALPSCATEGVHPSAAAVVAAVQVAQALRSVLARGPPAPLPSRMLVLDVWTNDWRTVELTRTEQCPACSHGRRDFLTAAERDVVTTLCGSGVVQISPAAKRGAVDLEAKLGQWKAAGLNAWRTGPVLTLDLGDVRLHVFASGRAIVKGTAEHAVAKGAYARYVLK